MDLGGLVILTLGREILVHGVAKGVGLSAAIIDGLLLSGQRWMWLVFRHGLGPFSLFFVLSLLVTVVKCKDFSLCIGDENGGLTTLWVDER